MSDFRERLTDAAGAITLAGLALTLLTIPGGFAHWVFLALVAVPGLVWLTAGRLWHVVVGFLLWGMSS